MAMFPILAFIMISILSVQHSGYPLFELMNTLTIQENNFSFARAHAIHVFRHLLMPTFCHTWVRAYLMCKHQNKKKWESIWFCSFSCSFFLSVSSYPTPLIWRKKMNLKKLNAVAFTKNLLEAKYMNNIEMVLWIICDLGHAGKSSVTFQTCSKMKIISMLLKLHFCRIPSTTIAMGLNAGIEYEGKIDKNILRARELLRPLHSLMCSKWLMQTNESLVFYDKTEFYL